MTEGTKNELRLSTQQAALLESAVEQGYFEVPRKVSLLDLADQHGLSDRDASRELRRALDTALREQFLDS